MALLEVARRVDRDPPTLLEERTAIMANPSQVNQLWDSFDRYYCDNEKTIMEAAQFDILEIGSSKKSTRYEAAMTSFLENSKTILHGLQFLSQLHPAIGVAVGAFGAVIKIELLRRDNNAKAMSVKIQMQNLMCALFQVRLLRTEQHDFTTSKRLADMMNIIAEEIKACGSDLNYYQEKKLVSRLIHANFFEQRLAGHIATFAERRSELELLLASYTAGRVHETAAIASRLEYKVDNLVHLLHRLDTPREKEASRFVEYNGGIAQCIDREDLLVELMDKTGDPVEGLDAASGEDLKSLRTQLMKEMREDINEILTKNLENFDAMLRIQNNNLEHMSHLMENQTSQIMKISNDIAMAFPGMRKHVLLTDPILQKIWLEMGLRQSVKAKKFVLTFKDYHARLQPKSPMILATPNVQIVELPPSGDLESGFMKPINDSETISIGGDIERECVEDEWALNYIDVVHLDPIVEAIDDDFSGFISIHEANRFAIGRPKTWSLLRWFAYWAAGWALSIEKYKKKILEIVQEIYTARLDALPCNRAYVGDYLDGVAFHTLDHMLRSTQPLVGELDSSDSKLAKLVSDFDDKQEARLLSNLKDLKYSLTGIDKVTLVTGSGRIERFAFPMIYLLLKHQLHIVRLASQYRLCSIEMTACSTSFLQILAALEARANKLEAIFRQKSRSIQDQFKKFSFGMFVPFQEKYETRSNTILEAHWEKSAAFEDADAESEDKGEDGVAIPKVPKFTLTEEDKGALKMLAQPLDHDEDRPNCDVEQTIINDFTRSEDFDDNPGIAGTWTARLHRDRGLSLMQRDLMVMYLDDPGVGAEISGAAETFSGPAKLSGTLERGTSSSTGEGEEGKAAEEGPIIALDFKMVDASGLIYHFKASPIGDHSYHWASGEWRFLDYEHDTGVRPFEMFRMPPEAFRYYHHLQNAVASDPEPPVEERIVTSVSGDTGSNAVDTAVQESPSTAPPNTEEASINNTLVVEEEKTPSAGVVVDAEATSGTAPDAEVSPSEDSSPADMERSLTEEDAPPVAEEASISDDTKLPVTDDSKPTAAKSDEVKHNPKAYARWKFALGVVSFQVRQRLHSKSFYEERARERRRWINSSMKISHSEQTENDWCEFLWLKQMVHPNTTSVWERAVAFYLDRKVAESVTSYAHCDYCGNQFCFTRHFCITCQLESLDNQIDICGQCLHKTEPVTTENFTHRPSHTIFKTTRRLLNMEKAHHVKQARIRSKRVKQIFRPSDGAHHHGGSKEAKKDLEIKCSSCEEDVHLPCWVCTVCPGDTFLCLNCETGIKHDPSHPLLRIFDSVEAETQSGDPVEKYLSQAKTMLGEEMKTINSRMNAMVEHVDKIQKAVAIHYPNAAPQISQIASEEERVGASEGGGETELAQRLSNFEKDVNMRLSSLESMLLRVLEAVNK
ncbi:hypothetical protein DFP72DRAFT_1174531 [Ephemerocybe angulata]|uniref:Uncharacterized protein n=1 Tax=Ephemerocybe angulata TaxID=980116 RepID=A0A8H6M0V1_9AGAR|nr:hypothetical protein DFP72DRAFT_1174531 [Tulosesus angulatus]